MMNLIVKKISEKAHIPTKHNINDAAFDIYSIEAVTLFSGETVTVHTGICLEIASGYYGKIESRSSLAKRGIFCTAGVIDAGYRGEVMIVMNNRGKDDYNIQVGHRIAQLLIHKVEEVRIVESENLDGQKDRGGGFGSSGK